MVDAAEQALQGFEVGQRLAQRGIERPLARSRFVEETMFEALAFFRDDRRVDPDGDGYAERTDNDED